MTLLLVVILGIIWTALLLPSRRRKTSPTTSVEEFERKMSSLAEANNALPGRWVLMPRKGKRIMEPRERTRFRVRRRRRHIFMVLLEATLLTLLIGLFPPLHKMLLGALMCRLPEAEQVLSGFPRSTRYHMEMEVRQLLLRKRGRPIAGAVTPVSEQPQRKK